MDEWRRENRYLKLTRAGVIPIICDEQIHGSGQPIKANVATIYDQRYVDLTAERLINERTVTQEYYVNNANQCPKYVPFVSNQIIGWTKEKERMATIMLFRQTPQLFTISQTLEVFTDTIFPVVTDLELNPLQFHTQLLNNYMVINGQPAYANESYQSNLQLVLMDPNPYDIRERPDTMADVICILNNEECRNQLIGYKADLRLFMSNPSVDKYTLNSQSIVRFILDKQDIHCSLLGLYTGYTQQQDRTHLCWPVFKPNARVMSITWDHKDQKSSYRSPFRHSANKRPFFRRIGYLVSKQALLCVCERKQMTKSGQKQHFMGVKSDDYYFTSLLKDNTFYMGDSQHLMVDNIKGSYYEMLFYPYTQSFQPKVLVIPEGLNGLVIQESHVPKKQTQTYFFVQTILLNANKFFPQLLCLDWSRFQSDFDAFAPLPVEPYMQPVMILNDIHDHRLIDVRDANFRICFSLCFSLCLSHRTGNMFVEHYNVFTERPDQVTNKVTDEVTDELADKETNDVTRIYGNRRFYYLDSCKCQWRYPANYADPLSFIRIQSDYKPIPIPTDEIFVTIRNWIQQNSNWLAYKLATTTIHQKYNLSPISVTKMFMFDKFKHVFLKQQRHPTKFQM